MVGLLFMFLLYSTFGIWTQNLFWVSVRCAVLCRGAVPCLCVVCMLTHRPQKRWGQARLSLLL